MTQEEADKIAVVIGTADGGCHSCVTALVDELNDARLGYSWASTGEFADDDGPSRIIVAVRKEGDEELGL